MLHLQYANETQFLREFWQQQGYMAPFIHSFKGLQIEEYLQAGLKAACQRRLSRENSDF